MKLSVLSIFASFTFLFFAIEAAIMSLALEMWFGLPLAIGYVVSSVVVIPLGIPQRPDSVVLRPIDSVDGMTARAVRLPWDLLGQMVRELMEVEGVAGVFYDLTNKPPATIEWE